MELTFCFVPQRVFHFLFCCCKFSAICRSDLLLRHWNLFSSSSTLQNKTSKTCSNVTVVVLFSASHFLNDYPGTYCECFQLKQKIELYKKNKWVLFFYIFIEFRNTGLFYLIYVCWFFLKLVLHLKHSQFLDAVYHRECI